MPFDEGMEAVCTNCYAAGKDRLNDRPCRECRRNPHHVDEYMSIWVKERLAKSEG
jgi:hypothetical protein